MTIAAVKGVFFNQEILKREKQQKRAMKKMDVACKDANKLC